ncbi:MAG: 30S ribosomal protein S6 [bacterium]|nr:30S ribosomal protein S6 [bacterium]
MKQYECMLVVNPETKKDDLEKLFSKIEALITKEGGTIEGLKEWGLRRLAYPIDKHKEAFYYLLYFDASKNIIPELEGLLRISLPILRYMTTKKFELIKAKDNKSKGKVSEKTAENVENVEPVENIESKETAVDA